MRSLDRLFMDRAIELAALGVGSTSPNPPVGAVIVRDGQLLGEGYHHRAGEPHAEVNALTQTADASGATVYVSLEPCNHTGRTPPCSRALIDAKVARVVIAAADPNPKTNRAGISALREAGIQVDLVDDERARDLIEMFSFATQHDRPFIALKMAMSLDGRVTSRPRVQKWITSDQTRLRVRELRHAFDAVMVGAGTIRADNSRLTVRPPAHRLHPYARIVVCEGDTVPEGSRVFSHEHDYAKTIVLAPTGARDKFENIATVAHVMFVGNEKAMQLNLEAAMKAIKGAGIQSVLCEGGPTLGARLLARKLVDRFYWAIGPMMLSAADAVPVLGGADLATLDMNMAFDNVEMLGPDIMISGRFNV